MSPDCPPAPGPSPRRLGENMGLETSAGVREARFLGREAFFCGADFFGAGFFFRINFFFGLARFFADFFLRAGFFLAMRKVYHSRRGGTTGGDALTESQRLNTENTEKRGGHGGNKSRGSSNIQERPRAPKIESCVAATVARISAGTHFIPNSWQGTRPLCATA